VGLVRAGLRQGIRDENIPEEERERVVGVGARTSG
jgi:hypothetical protein